MIMFGRQRRLSIYGLIISVLSVLVLFDRFDSVQGTWANIVLSHYTCSMQYIILSDEFFGFDLPTNQLLTIYLFILFKQN